MKYRTKDRDYVKSKPNQDHLKGFNRSLCYQEGEKKTYYDKNQILQTYYEVRDTYEVLESGLVKCLRCYSLTIPVIDEDGRLHLFNVEDSEPHFKRVKETKRGIKREQRKGYQFLCHISHGDKND